MSAPEEKPKKRGIRHLTAKEKAAAIALWEQGVATLEDLATKFKKNPDTFAKMFRKLGVKKGSKAEALREKVEERLAKEIVDEAAIIANRVRESRDETYKVLSALNKLVTQEVANAVKEKRSVSTTINAQKALNIAADTVLKTWRGRAEVLGIADGEAHGDDLPDLKITELSQDQIRKMIADEGQNMNIDDALDVLEGADLAQPGDAPEQMGDETPPIGPEA